MTTLGTSITNQKPWLTPVEVGGLVKDRDYQAGWMYNLNLKMIALAQEQGKSVFEMYRGQATSELRRDYALYLHLAYILRILKGWADDTGRAWATVKESDFPTARAYWLQRAQYKGVKGPRWLVKGWGHPDEIYLAETLKMAGVNFSSYQESTQ